MHQVGPQLASRNIAFETLPYNVESYLASAGIISSEHLLTFWEPTIFVGHICLHGLAPVAPPEHWARVSASTAGGRPTLWPFRGSFMVSSRL